MKKISIKEVLTSGNWIITKVMQGYRGQIRINAERRFRKDDEPSLFCEWCSKKYADRLRVEEGYNKLEITHY